MPPTDKKAEGLSVLSNNTRRRRLYHTNPAYAETAKRLGVLLASGLIVGESLFGVFTAAVIVSTNNGEPFGLIPADAGWPAMLVAVPAFLVVVYGLYAWTKSKAAKV